MNLALNDPEIHAVLKAHGLDDAETAKATGLISNLETQLLARSKTLSEKLYATTDLSEAIDINRNEYLSFREIARGCFPSRADRVALHVVGDVPDDVSGFLTMATLAYQATLSEPYASKLAKRGYGTSRLQQLSAGLESLNHMAAEKVGTYGSAMSQTAARDEAYEELRAFMREWKSVARGSLRTQPLVLRRLGL